MDHCTCEPGRAHDGSEFGPCEFCEAENDREYNVVFAAPDLLTALRECLEQAEGCWLNHYGENPEGSAVPQHIASARAAIAKAELANLDGTLGNLRQLQHEREYYRLTKWGRMVVDDATSALENVLSNKPFPVLRTGGGR